MSSAINRVIEGEVDNSRLRLGFIQTLRALAALSVVSYHLIKQGHQIGQVTTPLYVWSQTLQFGVDIFFVISGFIMVYITKDLESGIKNGATFFAKRLIRVAPIYWIASFLTLLVLLAAPSSLNNSFVDVPYFLASIFFIPWPSPNSTGLLPVLGLGWSLNYEVFFYLVVSCAIAVAGRFRIAAIFGVVLALVAVGPLISLPSAPQLWYWTRSTPIEFLYGALLALWMFSKRLPQSDAAGLGLLIAGLVAWQIVPLIFFPFDPSARGFLLGIPAAFIFGGVLMSPAIKAFLERGGRFSLGQRIGDASYSLYLLHMFAVRAVMIVFGRINWPDAPYIFKGSVALAACIIFAMLSYRFIERPIFKLGSRLLGLSESERSSAATAAILR